MITFAGTAEGFPHPILRSCSWSRILRIIASEWNADAVVGSRKEMNAHDFSGKIFTLSIGPKRTWLSSSSTEASAGRFPTYTVRPCTRQRIHQREGRRRTACTLGGAAEPIWPPSIGNVGIPPNEGDSDPTPGLARPLPIIGGIIPW